MTDDEKLLWMGAYLLSQWQHPDKMSDWHSQTAHFAVEQFRLYQAELPVEGDDGDK